MKKVSVLGFLVVISALCINGYAQENPDVYEKVYSQATIKDSVREISYEQFVEIRKTGQEYVLLDVLSNDSYNEGRIEGAVNFPLEDINKDSAQKLLSKNSKVIVYCGSFKCTASTAAAKKLSQFGYKAADYKGGLKEWQEKGNKLVK